MNHINHSRPTTLDLITAINDSSMDMSTIYSVLKDFGLCDHDFTESFPSLNKSAQIGDVADLIKQLSDSNLLKLPTLSVVDINEVNHVVYLNSLISTAIKNQYLNGLGDRSNWKKNFIPDWSERRSFITDIQMAQFAMAKKLLMDAVMKFTVDTKVDLSNAYPPVVLALIKDSLLNIAANQNLVANPEQNNLHKTRARI